MKKQVTTTLVSTFICSAVLMIPASIATAEVNAGVATLTGTVETSTQKEQASGLAPPKGIVQKTEDKVKSGIDKSIDATEQGLEKTGEALSKAGEINVDCDQHVVTLRGTVATEAGRTRAVELARKTKGVRRIVDKLTIGPKQS